MFEPVTSGETEFIISRGDKRTSYHRADPESDDPRPACNTTRKVGGAWKHATKSELTFIDPCTREGCFRGEDGE